MCKQLPLLRAAVDADGPAIIELIGGCFAEYAGCVLDLPGIDAWMRTPASAYAGDARLWVVTLGQQLVATVGAKPTAQRRVELKSLYVAATARRRGLGRRLVALVEARARELAADTVELWSDSRFADAHRLYEALGYRRGAQTRQLHDPSNTTEYFYTKAL